MIEKKTGAVNERPGQILNDDKPFVGQLPGAGDGVVAQLHQAGIQVNGFLRFGKRQLELCKLRIVGQRFGRFGGCLPSLPEFRVSIPIVFKDGRGLFGLALAGRGASGLDNGLGHAEVEGILTGGDVKTEPAQQQVIAVVLLQVEPHCHSVCADDGILELKGGKVALEGRGPADCPPVSARIHFAIDCLANREVTLRKVRLGVRELNIGVRRICAGRPGQLQFTEDKVPIVVSARTELGQPIIGEDLEHHTGNIGEWGSRKDQVLRIALAARPKKRAVALARQLALTRGRCFLNLDWHPGGFSIDRVVLRFPKGSLGG